MKLTRLLIILLLFISVVSAESYCFEVSGKSAIKDLFKIQGIDQGRICVNNVEELINGGKEIKVTGSCEYSEQVYSKMIELGFIQPEDVEYIIICQDVKNWANFGVDFKNLYSSSNNSEKILLKIEDLDVDVSFIETGERVDLRLNFLGTKSQVMIEEGLDFEFLTLLVGIFLILVVIVFAFTKRKWVKPPYREKRKRYHRGVDTNRKVFKL